MKVGPFGYSYLIDCYGAKDLDNLEKMYRFLEELTHRLGMTLMGNVQVFHGPTHWVDGERRDIFADKAGVTGIAPLIESAIVCHTICEKQFLTIDVYSCKPYEKKTVYDFLKETFDFESCDEVYLERGLKYGS